MSAPSSSSSSSDHEVLLPCARRTPVRNTCRGTQHAAMRFQELLRREEQQKSVADAPAGVGSPRLSPMSTPRSIDQHLIEMLRSGTSTPVSVDASPATSPGSPRPLQDSPRMWQRWTPPPFPTMPVPPSIDELVRARSATELSSKDGTRPPMPSTMTKKFTRAPTKSALASLDRLTTLTRLSHVVEPSNEAVLVQAPIAVRLR